MEKFIHRESWKVCYSFLGETLDLMLALLVVVEVVVVVVTVLLKLSAFYISAT